MFNIFELMMEEADINESYDRMMADWPNTPIGNYMMYHVDGHASRANACPRYHAKRLVYFLDKPWADRLIDECAMFDTHYDVPVHGPYEDVPF